MSIKKQPKPLLIYPETRQWVETRLEKPFNSEAFELLLVPCEHRASEWYWRMAELVQQAGIVHSDQNSSLAVNPNEFEGLGQNETEILEEEIDQGLGRDA